MTLPRTTQAALVARRKALLSRLTTPALLSAGLPRSRNYRANRYPFRAASHFLYFTGTSIPGACVLFATGRVTLFVEPEAPGDALWHGPQPSFEEHLRDLGANRVIMGERQIALEMIAEIERPEHPV